MNRIPPHQEEWIYQLFAEQLQLHGPSAGRDALTWMQSWIDEQRQRQEEQRMGHSETLAMDLATDPAAEQLDAAVHAGAVVFLSFGAAPVPELVRVLTQHLEMTPGEVRAALLRITDAGGLNLAGQTVSLPTGGGQREIKERDR